MNSAFLGEPANRNAPCSGFAESHKKANAVPEDVAGGSAASREFKNTPKSNRGQAVRSPTMAYSFC